MRCRTSALCPSDPIAAATRRLRCLAATANNFARESFMDELASAAATDPLAFRMAHLQDARLRAVLEAAAQKFDWNTRRKQ